jgi:hypothetical protein
VRASRCLFLLLLLVSFAQRAGQRPHGQPWPRAGVVVPATTRAEILDLLGPVWYYQYGFEGPDLRGHQRVYLVPLYFAEEPLVQAMRQHPESWWLVGNEPNDAYQDNLTPAAYAAFYRRVELLARRAGGAARLVPAGLANADWRWAEAFRQSYRAQYGHYPRVAAWNIHNYILAPGTSQYDVAEFQRRIIAFRGWMAQSGEGDKPLLLTEYGVLYGSGCCQRPLEDPALGIAFLRQATRWLWETDHVQAWSWFCLYSRRQFNGDLLDDAGQLTPFGQAYREAVREGLEVR